MPDHPEAGETDPVDYRAFVTEAYDMMCVAGVDGRFRWLNDAWPRTLGWSKDELMARPFLSFVHPDDQESTLGEVASLAEGKPTLRFVNRYAHRDGTWRWLEWVTRPTDEGLLYAIARDVTELRQSMTALRRHIELLEVAEQVSRVGHWRVDLANESVHWSPQVYRIHGYEPGSFQPSLADGIEAYHPDDREVVADAVGRSVKEGSSFDFRLRLIRADGEERLVHSRGMAERDGAGGVNAIFGVFQDVTDQVSDLQRRNEELERFAYAAAHDLQAPLKTVLGFGWLLRDELGDALSEDASLYLERLLRSSARMARLTDGLLAFAQTARGRQWAPVCLTHVAEEAALGLDAQVRATGAEITVGALPVVQGDEAQLGSLLQNLIANAIRYRRDEPPKIEVSAEREGSRWRVEVRDNGIGIDPQHTARVFALFQRIQPREDDDADRPLGLGLSLCKRIVESHGGDIGVTSEPGVGSTFYFTLPRLESPA